MYSIINIVYIYIYIYLSSNYNKYRNENISNLCVHALALLLHPITVVLNERRCFPFTSCCNSALLTDELKSLYIFFLLLFIFYVYIEDQIQVSVNKE